MIKISIQDIKKKNELYQILSPNENDEGVWIHQDAWFHLGEFDNETAAAYQVKKEGNGGLLFHLRRECGDRWRKFKQKRRLWGLGYQIHSL